MAVFHRQLFFFIIIKIKLFAHLLDKIEKVACHLGIILLLTTVVNKLINISIVYSCDGKLICQHHIYSIYNII